MAIGEVKDMLDLNWEDLVRQYHAQLYRLCCHLLGSSEKAEDALQKTWLKAFRTKGSLRDVGAVKYWLYAIARNVCLDELRWWKRFNLFRFSAPIPENIVASPELSLVLSQLIAALPLRQREVFILRHWHKFSTEETALLLGIGVGTVKSHLKRAIARLKQELTSNFEGGTTRTRTESSVTLEEQ